MLPAHQGYDASRPAVADHRRRSFRPGSVRGTIATRSDEPTQRARNGCAAAAAPDCARDAYGRPDRRPDGPTDIHASADGNPAPN